MTRWMLATSLIGIAIRLRASRTARVRFEITISERRLADPIIKDKTFFFGAYEGQRERVTSDFTLLVPTQQQILDAQQLVI